MTDAYEVMEQQQEQTFIQEGFRQLMAETSTEKPLSENELAAIRALVPQSNVPAWKDRTMQRLVNMLSAAQEAENSAQADADAAANSGNVGIAENPASEGQNQANRDFSPV